MRLSGKQLEVSGELELDINKDNENLNLVEINKSASKIVRNKS